MKSDNNLIWIDLEMTGLDVNRDAIIEIATLITDKHLNVLAEGPVIAINQTDEVLDGMDEWNTRQHGQSGLTLRVQQSRYGYEHAEEETIEFIRQYVSKGASPMCGNSICQDRRFLARLMPDLEHWFHYRNLDVSSLKELVQRWKPEIIKGFTKKTQHLAMSDIHDSIDELRYYRQNFINLE